MSTQAPRAAAIAAAAVVAVLFAGSVAEATILRDLRLADLVAQSDAVVVGTVVDAKSAWDGAGAQIFTDVTVDVGEYVVGVGPRRLQVRQQGGRVGDVVMHVAGNAAFAPGEEVVLFLIRQDGFSYTVGMELGKYTIARDGSDARVHRATTVPVATFVDARRLGPMRLGTADLTWEGAALERLLAEIRSLAARKAVDGGAP